MAIKGLTLQLLLAAAFYNCFVSGATDCTLPWFGRITSERDAEKLGFIDETKYVFNNICPTPIVGDPNKEYCCYNMHGEVECCDAQHFIVMGFVCLIPIFVIILLMCCFICRMCCSCCFIFKRRQNGRVLGVPSPTNYVFVEALPTTLANHHSYYPPASTGKTPLIPNEYSPHTTNLLK